MPDTVWPHQEKGMAGLTALYSHVLVASPAKCPIRKFKTLANSFDAETPPPPPLPQLVGSSVELFAHGQGREVGLLCPLEPYRGRTVSSEGASCSTETDGKPQHLSYVS